MPDSDSKKETTISSSTNCHDATKDPSVDVSHRFMGWTALCFLSIIALAAQVSATWGEDRNSDDWFIIAVSITSVACSFFAIIGFAMARIAFPGSAIEGLLAVVVQLMWICGMPVIMDPDRDIAVSKGINTDGSSTHEFTYIRNANIYFFSWASTIAIVYVLGRFVRQVVLEKQRRNSNAKTRRAAALLLKPQTNLWYLLILASLVVLVDSIELYRAFGCTSGNDDDNPDDLCLATNYAVALGTVGTLLSVMASILATTGNLGRWTELLFSLIMFGLYMAGFGLITFNEGPGTTPGNLYFATWMGAGVTAVLLMRAYRDMVQYCQNRNNNDEEEEVPEEKPQEEPVIFPDVEMGQPKDDDKKNKEEENSDQEQEPAWAKVEETEKETSTPTKPSSSKPDENQEEEEEEAEIEVEWNSEPKTKEEPKVIVKADSKKIKSKPEKQGADDDGDNKKNGEEDIDDEIEPKKEEETKPSPSKKKPVPKKTLSSQSNSTKKKPVAKQQPPVEKKEEKANDKPEKYTTAKDEEMKDTSETTTKSKPKEEAEMEDKSNETTQKKSASTTTTKPTGGQKKRNSSKATATTQKKRSSAKAKAKPTNTKPANKTKAEEVKTEEKNSTNPFEDDNNNDINDDEEEKKQESSNEPADSKSDAKKKTDSDGANVKKEPAKTEVEEDTTSEDN